MLKNQSSRARNPIRALALSSFATLTTHRREVLPTTCWLAFAIATAVSSALAQPQLTFAQTPTRQLASTPSLDLARLFELAWQQHPAALAEQAVADELAARQTRAHSWLAAAPSLSVGLRTDRPTAASRREGLRELEFEVGLPIATFARQRQQAATVKAESEVAAATLAAHRIQLAAQLREGYWALRQAEVDVEGTRADLARAKALADDTNRRARAGEAARVDALQAEANAERTALALVHAEALRDKAAVVLTGMAGLRVASPGHFNVAAVAEARPNAALASTLPATHAELVLATTVAAAARVRLAESTRYGAEAPSLSLTLANERSDLSPAKNTARIGFTIGFDALFGSNTFSAPAVAAARRAVAEADAQRANVERLLTKDLHIAQQNLAVADAQAALAKRRAALAFEAAALFDKAYRLGELDLPSRLRSEGERVTAEREARRTQLDVAHAISRLNQALGLLP